MKRPEHHRHGSRLAARIVKVGASRFSPILEIHFRQSSHPSREHARASSKPCIYECGLRGILDLQESRWALAEGRVPRGANMHVSLADDVSDFRYGALIAGQDCLAHRREFILIAVNDVARRVTCEIRSVAISAYDRGRYTRRTSAAALSILSFYDNGTSINSVS